MLGTGEPPRERDLETIKLRNEKTHGTAREVLNETFGGNVVRKFPALIKIEESFRPSSESKSAREERSGTMRRARRRRQTGSIIFYSINRSRFNVYFRPLEFSIEHVIPWNCSNYRDSS